MALEPKMIRFIEVINLTDYNPRMERTAIPRFGLGEVWVNRQYVVSIREATGYKQLLKEGSLPSDLAPHHTFSTLVTNQGKVTETHVVVGSPEAVASRLNCENKILLKG